jgi:hypothetical protein
MLNTQPNRFIKYINDHFLNDLLVRYYLKLICLPFLYFSFKMFIIRLFDCYLHF